MISCCCGSKKTSTSPEELIRLTDDDELRLQWFVKTASYIEALRTIKMRKKDLRIVDLKNSIALAFVDLLMSKPERPTSDDVIYSAVYRAFRPAVEKHLRHLRCEMTNMGEELLYTWLTSKTYYYHVIHEIVQLFREK